jgi:DNA-binding response OmpR family regulator
MRIMNANALLLSRDDEVQSIVPVLLGGMRIETEIVTDVLTAARLLSERKFEAIIVDCELSGAETVLRPQMDVRDGLPAGAKFI